MAQTLEKKIESELGAMHLQLLNLSAQNEKQQERIAELEKQLATSKAAASKKETKT
jgi:hypothetical protein